MELAEGSGTDERSGFVGSSLRFEGGKLMVMGDKSRLEDI